MPSRPADPTPATTKRLYALSGNQCSFPKCEIPLVDVGGKVTGRICHIEAAEPGGPRYNAVQTMEERRAFENLTVMCPVHADVIDADVDSYTGDRLREIKRKHEEANAGGTEPSDAVAEQLIANISGNVIVGGSVIFTSNQMGGQVAHSITNVGSQPRVISQAAANAAVAELRANPPEGVEITTAWGDPEAHHLAEQLKAIFEAGGWTVAGVNHAMFTVQLKQVAVGVGEITPLRILVLNILNDMGLRPIGEHAEGLDDMKIAVGSNL